MKALAAVALRISVRRVEEQRAACSREGALLEYETLELRVGGHCDQRPGSLRRHNEALSSSARAFAVTAPSCPPRTGTIQAVCVVQVNPPNIIIENREGADFTHIAVDSANRPGTLVEVRSQAPRALSSAYNISTLAAAKGPFLTGRSEGWPAGLVGLVDVAPCLCGCWLPLQGSRRHSALTYERGPGGAALHRAWLGRAESSDFLGWRLVC